MMNKIQQAAIASLEKEVNNIPENVSDYEFSEGFNKKSNKLLKRMKNDKLIKFSKKYFAIILVAAIIISSTIIVAIAEKEPDPYTVTYGDEYIEFNRKYTDKDWRKVVDADYSDIGFELVEDCGYGKEFENSSGDSLSISKHVDNLTASFNPNDSKTLNKDGITYYCSKETYDEVKYGVVYEKDYCIYHLTLTLKDDTDKTNDEMYDWLIELSHNIDIE